MAENMTMASNSDFKSWVSQLKQDIRSAQIRAAIKVNTELLRLYWRMGADICEKQKSASWGDGWLKELSRELMTEFPDMKGFSHRNLQYIRQWYLFYNQENTIVQQAVAQLEDVNVQQAVAKLDDDMRQQTVAQISEDVFFSVPWGHHLYIISQCKDVSRAVFYLKKTVENGWSRAVLLNYLDTNLYERQGKAVNNFNRLLANPQSELAAQTLKDPYNFDFLTLREPYNEHMLEEALEHNIRRFLLELGTGFAYVGSQMELRMPGGTSYFPDMVFYHTKLKCYVVLELKVVKFEPEFAGKLNFYVSAADHLLKDDNDNPSIGLLVCKSKNETVVKWAFEGIDRPLGIATYELDEVLKKTLAEKLPSIEDIENAIEE